VCDLETSRMGAPYIYDISRLRVKQTKSYFIKLTQSLALPHSHRSRMQLTSLTDC